MTASREELAELGRALEGALGTGKADEPPRLDRHWRGKWPALAEMGITGFCIPDHLGGLGMEAAAAFVASRALGAALHGAPYPGVVAAGYALARGLEGTQRAEVCEAIVSGRILPTVAFLDPSSKVSGAGRDQRIEGRAHLVLGAEDCDAFVLLRARPATMLFVPERARCTLCDLEGFDVTRSIADVAFDGAQAIPIGSEAERRVTELLYGLLLAGDALGGVERMLERTRAYAFERVAFGRPIAGFQAVQHRLVDHAVRVRGMSLLGSDAAGAIGESADSAERRVRLAESAVAGGAVRILHDLLQLTGAIAFTWEHGLHYYERRSHLDARLGRNPRTALRSLVELERWVHATATA